MAKLEFKSPPMDHQRRAMRQAWSMREHALFHEMGTGKTFTTINLAVARYLAGQINCLVVVAPTAIKSVWRDEIEKWATIPTKVMVMQPGSKLPTDIRYPLYRDGDEPLLRVVVAGIEAMSQGHAFPRLFGWMSIQDHSMMVVDESSRIKNHKANRTKRIQTLGTRADYRIILTGTSITQGIQDLYAQFSFLNPKIIGMSSFFQFRNRYCVMGGFEGKKITGYQNTDELMKKISPYVDIVKKKDALDLPPKVYEKINVDLTDQQKYLIKELKTYHEAQHKSNILTADTMLERLTRFQQIIGGHFPYRGEDLAYVVDRLDSVPKLDALLEMLQEEVQPDVSVIIWARFRPEIALISDALSDAFGKDSVVEFHGGISSEARDLAKERFQNKQARFFISNQATGGMGLTLTAATLVIYYSNSFSMEDRLQSEDRCHRKGQENKVTYVDIEANHPYDAMILQAVTKKRDMRDFVDERMEMFKSLTM